MGIKSRIAKWLSGLANMLEPALPPPSPFVCDRNITVADYDVRTVQSVRRVGRAEYYAMGEDGIERAARDARDAVARKIADEFAEIRTEYDERTDAILIICRAKTLEKKS